jgi:hypothetical protein
MPLPVIRPAESNPSSLQLDLNALTLTQTHFVLLDEPNNVRLDFHIPQTAIDVKKLDLNTSIIRLNEIAFYQANLQVEKLPHEIEPEDSTGLDTAIVHLNTKPLQLFVSSLKFVNSEFRFDDNNEPVTQDNSMGFTSYIKTSIWNLQTALLCWILLRPGSGISASQKKAGLK